MPKPYESMRDEFAEGAPKHKKRPVTGKHKKKAKLSSSEAAESLFEKKE